MFYLQLWTSSNSVLGMGFEKGRPRTTNRGTLANIDESVSE